MIDEHDIIDVTFSAGNRFVGDLLVRALGHNFTGVIRDTDGDILYLKDGEWHREDGPAMISSSADVIKWWFNGEPLELEDWLDAIDADEVTKTYYRVVYG